MTADGSTSVKVAKLRLEELKNQSPHYFKDELLEDLDSALTAFSNMMNQPFK